MFILNHTTERNEMTYDQHVILERATQSCIRHTARTMGISYQDAVLHHMALATESNIITRRVRPLK